MGGNLIPAISRCLKARLYGWLPLSNAYGISFPCNTTQKQTPTAFSFIKNKTRSADFPNPTIWNQTFVMHNYK